MNTKCFLHQNNKIVHLPNCNFLQGTRFITIFLTPEENE